MSMFGKRMRAIRDHRGMTTTDVAMKTGLSQSYISRLETGVHSSPSLKTVKKIADALSVAPEQLLDERAVIPNEVIDGMPDDIQSWLAKKDVLPYLRLAMGLHGEKVPAEKVTKVIELYRKFMESDKDKKE